jgi:hypothetical protein
MLIRALVLSAVVGGVAAPSLTLAQVTPPAAPTDLDAVVVHDALAILLIWEDNADNEDSYIVERSTVGPSGPWVLVATLPPDSVDYPDSGLEDGVTYWYRVAAVNSAGSAYSNVDFGRASALPMFPTSPPTVTPVSPPPAALPDTGDGSRVNPLPFIAISAALAVAALAAGGALALRRSRL